MTEPKLTPEEAEALREIGRRATLAVQRMSRGFAALGDAARLATDAMTREFGREWEHPERVLSDEEREAIEARQLGRTLADIDDLPEVDVRGFSA